MPDARVRRTTLRPARRWTSARRCKPRSNEGYYLCCCRPRRPGTSRTRPAGRMKGRPGALTITTSDELSATTRRLVAERAVPELRALKRAGAKVTLDAGARQMVRMTVARPLEDDPVLLGRRRGSITQTATLGTERQPCQRDSFRREPAATAAAETCSASAAGMSRASAPHLPCAEAVSQNGPNSGVSISRGTPPSRRRRRPPSDGTATSFGPIFREPLPPPAE